MSKEKKPEYHKAVMPFFFPLKDRENKEYDIYALIVYTYPIQEMLKPSLLVEKPAMKHLHLMMGRSFAKFIRAKQQNFPNQWLEAQNERKTILGLNPANFPEDEQEDIVLLKKHAERNPLNEYLSALLHSDFVHFMENDIKKDFNRFYHLLEELRINDFNIIIQDCKKQEHTKFIMKNNVRQEIKQSVESKQEYAYDFVRQYLMREKQRQHRHRR